MAGNDDPELDQPINPEDDNETNWLDELASEPTNLIKKDPEASGDDAQEDLRTDDKPDWHTGELAQDISDEESIPEWLRGEVSTGANEQVGMTDTGDNDEDVETTAIYDQAPKIPEENIPEWLRDKEPNDVSAGLGTSETDDLSWLDQIAAGEGAAIDEPPTLSWDEPDDEQEADEERAAEEDLTWLDDMSTLPGVTAAELAGRDIEDQSEEKIATDEPIIGVAEEMPIEDLVEQDELPSEETDQPLIEESADVEATVDEVPEDPDEAMAWLEQLAARQGAREEELPTLTGVSDTGEDEGELSVIFEEEASIVEDEDILSSSEQSSTLPEDEEPIPVLGDTAPTPILDTNDIPEDPDEAMAWLEKMAADEDVEDEELPEKMPADLLLEEDELVEDIVEYVPEEEVVAESSGPEEAEIAGDFDEALSWLEELVTEPEPSSEARQIEGDKASPVEELESESDVADDEDAMAWLEQLAARQGADLDELTTIEGDEPLSEAPEWLRQELDEALDETADIEGKDTGASAAGYSIEDLLEAESLEVESFESEEEALDQVRDFDQAPESELVDEAVRDIEEAEELIAEAEFLEDDADELDVEAQDLETESEKLGAEAALLAAISDEVRDDQEQVEMDEVSLEEVTSEDELVLDELDIEADMLEEAIKYEEEAQELESEVEELKLEAETKMDEAEELMAEIEDQEVSAIAEETVSQEGEMADLFGDSELSGDELAEASAEMGDIEAADFLSEEEGVESKLPDEDELEWLETLGKVDADSWLEAEAEASSPELAVPAAFADLGSTSGDLEQVAIDEEMESLTSEADKILDADHLGAARQALESGELHSAIEAYGNLLDQGEGLPYLIAELEYSIESYGQQPLLQRLLGDTYVRNGQLKKAVEVYRQALDNI